MCAGFLATPDRPRRGGVADPGLGRVRTADGQNHRGRTGAGMGFQKSHVRGACRWYMPGVSSAMATTSRSRCMPSSCSGSCCMVGVWGAFSYERGSTLGYGHAQGVMRLMAVDAKDVRTQMMAFLTARVTAIMLSKLSICIKILSVKFMHTDVGMLGYVRKDMGTRYDDHQIEYHPSVTAAEKIEGDKLYAMFGNPSKVNTVKLTKVNVLERAAVYFKKFIHHPLHNSLEHVLTCMLRSGKYTISSEFLQYYGAINLKWAQTTFNAMIFPEATSKEDTLVIFFGQTYDSEQTASHYGRVTAPPRSPPVKRDGSMSPNLVGRAPGAFIGVPRFRHSADSDCDECNLDLHRRVPRG